jgi:hypothetical protein
MSRQETERHGSIAGNHALFMAHQRIELAGRAQLMDYKPVVFAFLKIN